MVVTYHQLHGVQVAYSPDGNPSKALQGFCKKNGVSVDSVTTEADSKGTKYVWAFVKQPGRSASEVCTFRPYSPRSHFAKNLSALAAFAIAASWMQHMPTDQTTEVTHGSS